MTDKEIRAKYKKQHDTFSAAYYAGKSRLTQEDFDLQHGQIWADMEAELIKEGYRPAPAPDWKAKYKKASTDNERLEILAERLGIPK